MIGEILYIAAIQNLVKFLATLAAGLIVLSLGFSLIRNSFRPDFPQAKRGLIWAGLVVIFLGVGLAGSSRLLAGSFNSEFARIWKSVRADEQVLKIITKASQGNRLTKEEQTTLNFWLSQRAATTSKNTR